MLVTRGVRTTQRTKLVRTLMGNPVTSLIGIVTIRLITNVRRRLPHALLGLRGVRVVRVPQQRVPVVSQHNAHGDFLFSHRRYWSKFMPSVVYWILTLLEDACEIDYVAVHTTDVISYLLFSASS